MINFKGFLLALSNFVFDLFDLFNVTHIHGNFYDCSCKIREGDTFFI